MIFDTDKLRDDKPYREEFRHRCETDHLFLADVVGLRKFVPRIHNPAVAIHFPKNRNLPIEEQHEKKNMLHLDPRLTYKTTLGRVDNLQWLLAFPETITMLNCSATQPLAEAISINTAIYLFRGRGGAPTPLQLAYPELVIDKYPTGTWDTPVRELGQLDATLDYTSPKSSQSGWHPWVMNADDMVDTENSGINADTKVRQAVIDKFDTNKYTVQKGGYTNLRGTRYHPRDLYGVKLESMDPDEWRVLIRGAMKIRSKMRLLPGEFPDEDDVELIFPDLPEMDYKHLRSRFYEKYEAFMCFRAGAKVLMADWSEKPIESLRVGDEIVGFEKLGSFRTFFTRVKVERTFSRKANVVKVSTDTGREIFTTRDHRFLRPSNGGDLRYAKLRVGSNMVSVYTPAAVLDASEQRDMDWLGGMIDGEGSIQKQQVIVYQSERENKPICDRLKAVLDRLKIGFSESKNRTIGRFVLEGGRSLLVRLMQQGKFAKQDVISENLWESKQLAETSGRRGGTTFPRVVSMEDQGEEVVYDIETTSHNFICDGFAVHNCQDMNDPQGGNVPTFDEDLYASMLIAEERVPALGETFICWRLAYQGKEYMAKYAEGCAARILEGKVYIVDAWQGTYTPSRLAEKIVRECKRHQTGVVMMEDLPGTQYIETHIRNEAMRRNVFLRIQWLEFQDDDNDRIERMRAIEPQARAGRILISTATGKAVELRKQLLNFGIVAENGIVDCISRMASKIPVSLLRTEIEDEELELQRSRRHELMNAFVYGQSEQFGGVDELAARKEQQELAAEAARESAFSFGLTDILGGLDG